MGGMITLKAADGFVLGAYDAKPAGEPRGGLVIVQEIFGVTAHIKRVCDGYAEDGYHAIAPAIFDRAERNVELSYDPDGVAAGRALAGKTSRTSMLADIAAAVAVLKESGPVAVVGYCLGGSLAWEAAALVDGLAATVGYYGGRIAEALDLKPKVPVMLHFGEKDQGIPLSDVDKVRAAVDPARVQIFTYPAGHAFNRDGTQNFEPHSAMLALARTLKFLAAMPA